MDPLALVPILCVDDDPLVLEGIAVNLRRRYHVSTALGGAAGLELLAARPDIAVIVSDMRMPGMDGAAFLRRARDVAPCATRMLLTGEAGVGSAIAAVNDGQIFRFLTKPCSRDRLLAALDAAAEQHRMVTAERVVLEQTLRRSIKMLTDVMSLVNPTAFGRATQIKNHAVQLAMAAGLAPIWQIEVAAMLSQLGGAVLAEATLDKIYLGQPLSKEEQAVADGLPAVAEGLIAGIPRLEDVRMCIRHQARRFDAAPLGSTGAPAEPIPPGARVLKIAIDFDTLEARGCSASEALDTMRGRTGCYDPGLLKTFAELRGAASIGQDVREIPLRLVSAGMVFADDVKTPAGALLLARGFEVTEALVDRIRRCPVSGNVRVIARRGGGPGSPEAASAERAPAALSRPRAT